MYDIPITIYGPLLYQNFWIILLTNIHKLPNHVLNEWIRDVYNILVMNFPELV